MMEFGQFVNWGFCGLLAFCALSAVKILGKLYDSVNRLSERVAVIVERTEMHEHRISVLEDKI